MHDSLPYAWKCAPRRGPPRMKCCAIAPEREGAAEPPCRSGAGRCRRASQNTAHKAPVRWTRGQVIHTTQGCPKEHVTGAHYGGSNYDQITLTGALTRGLPASGAHENNHTGRARTACHDSRETKPVLILPANTVRRRAHLARGACRKTREQWKDPPARSGLLSGRIHVGTLSPVSCNR